MSIKETMLAKLRGVFTNENPPLGITLVQPPILIVLMAGTSVQEYEEAGQLGRLSAALQRHTRYFRTVLLMTTDRTDYTENLDTAQVRHVRMPKLLPPGPSGGFALLLSMIFRFRSVSKAASVVILDEESAPAGWLASRLNGSRFSMSMGAPWAPPRYMNVEGKRRWLERAALRRVGQVVQWMPTDGFAPGDSAEVSHLPQLIDADLFCPLTTTDPTRPRMVGVFLGTEDEADARVMMGVAERLARRKQTAILRVFVSGHGAESRAAALQAEVAERGSAIEFQTMPRIEMLPDAIARLRMCIAFKDPKSIENLLRSMASGVPGIAVDREAGDSDDDVEAPGWSRFVLTSGRTEEELSRNIETLFREPGVRLRMAREGRRFVIASHSLEAVSANESRLLLGEELLEKMNFAPEAEFDADAEAEKLASMLELLGVARTEPEEAAEIAA